MKTAEFRRELKKIMPGYKWTVHNPVLIEASHTATGIQTAGFNRLSTLYVIRRVVGGNVEYKVKSSGFGLRAPWLSTFTDGTLARALRGLQNRYEAMASEYSNHAHCLQSARKNNNQTG